MINLSQKIAELSPAKRALLEARLMKKGVPDSPDKINSPPRSSNPELSFAQQSLWFLDRLEPNSSFYSIPQAMRISGPLNVEALRKSFEAIVTRHEVLRTQAFASDGNPKPRVVEPVAFELPLIDLSQLSENDQRVKASELIDAEAKRPFDLENNLMLRAGLVRLAKDEHILLLTVHHIAADLWSFSVLYRELAAVYRAFCEQHSCKLPELKIQYSDFARSQREFLRSETFEKQLAYWKEKLAGDLPDLELPTDFSRPKAQSFRGARKHIRIPLALTTRLKTLSQREGVTLYITLLAAFQTLLHRYSDQTDIIIGSPLGGRSQIETEQLIGYFLNTLVLRIDSSGDPDFREVLQRSREGVLGAFANQEIPFEKIVDELRIPRHTGRNPIFQTIFQFQPTPVPILQLHETETELLELENGTSKMDLVFTLAESESGLSGNLEYNTDLFEGKTIERILSQYGLLLESIVENPRHKISTLKLLSDSERNCLLVDWNRTQTDYPREKSVAQLFEEQVEQTPKAVALIFGDEELTYSEVNERANQLACHLQDCGVGPDKLVGICLDRSFELIIALLAILKAGGAYLPLDSGYPEERLRFMLDETAVSLLITDKEFAFSSARKINPNDFSAENSGSAGVLVRVPMDPKNLAYVMYTSGSTGKPKGVAVPHRAVVRLVKETNYVRITSNDVFLQFAPISFDASTFEIWGSLLNGARLVIHPPELPSLEELGQFLQRNQITTLWLTAGLFHQMVEQQIESLRGVKQLLAGGDTLSVPHVKKVLEQRPDCQLINGYGPTENTTFTCCFPVPKQWRGGRSVPIGKPISNTQVYILDKNLEPTPIGVPGELFIGGDGLARGYLNSPELNVEKFIPNPFRPNERLYRTGDKARYLEDGTIEFLGRLDQQIKIRGFRIELGEIEATLNQHPLIRQTAVLARENSNMEKYLAAYFTSEPGAAVTGSELRIYLEQKLPRYMVPLHFVPLDEFPLTKNGKVDRRKLPPSDNLFQHANGEWVAPRNQIEQKLFDIWREVLGQNQFGVHENFFQLGGHSLLATRVVSRITQGLQIQLSLRKIFEHPTIASLALAVNETALRNETRQPLLVRRNRGTKPGQPAYEPGEFSPEKTDDLVVTAK